MAQDFIDRLERDWGDWHMPGLSSFIVAMNAAVYGLCLFKPEFRRLLTLDPDGLLGGQVWRAATFLFIPPAVSPLWMFFWLYLLYVYATALEQEWGDFKFNLFYAIGGAATLAASLLMGTGLSNVTLNATIFLAFAALYPDYELLLFFILPVKVKWLAYLAWAGVAWGFLAGGWHSKVALLAGLCNYALFFGRAHWEDLRFLLKVRRNRKKYGRAFDGDDGEN